VGLIPYKNETYLDWSEERNILAMQPPLRRSGAVLDRATRRSSVASGVETDGEIVSVNPANPSQW
jgi:hypothetical protein